MDANTAKRNCYENFLEQESGIRDQGSGNWEQDLKKMTVST